MKRLLELLDANNYDAAYAHFTSLEENQRKECFEYLCKKKRSLIDLAEMKIVSVIRRKLKENHSMNDFIDAFLPEPCNRSGCKDEISAQFIDYWKSHGPVEGGAVFQAINLHDPSKFFIGYF